MTLAVCAWTGCNDKTDEAQAKAKASAVDLDTRCERFAKICGDKNKHVEKITDECKQAAKQQVEKGCADEAIAMYDCYEKELCASSDKVWAIDDVRVLADRHNKCVTERDASRACLARP